MTEQTRYWAQLPTEQFPPSELVDHALWAEQAGFDAVNVSDHLQPWWEAGQSGQAWALLGAIGQVTDRIAVGTGVTAPTYRYSPPVVAQLAATMEEMCPGRAFLGLGSGESLNESPCGMDWPSTGEQVARLDEALEIIDGLLAGRKIDHAGKYFRTKAAKLYTLPERRPPVYVSAFGPDAARSAARHGDGVWTLADPNMAPGVIDAYREARSDAGLDQGEVILQVGASWAETDDAALEGARVWKSAQMSEFFTDDWHDPRAMYEHAETHMSDEEFSEAFVVSSDPQVHLERIKQAKELGATVVCVQHASGADPQGSFRFYGEQVLPALRAEANASSRA